MRNANESLLIIVNSWGAILFNGMTIYPDYYCNRGQVDGFNWHNKNGFCNEVQYHMNYQKIICWGDSQTFGARSYGCYPLYLSQILTATTQYTWQVVNFSTNGHTVRDLWFRLQHELLSLKDSYQACILIGANDVGNQSPLAIFEEYYRQILNALEIARFHVAYCGEIPAIWPDGHPFFSSATVVARQKYNTLIKDVVDSSPIARLVEFPDLNADCYTDPVHLNESGNQVIADAFAKAIRSF